MFIFNTEPSYEAYFGRLLNVHSIPQLPLQIQHLSASEGREHSMHVSLELAATGLECKQRLALLQGLTSYFCKMGRNV